MRSFTLLTSALALFSGVFVAAQDAGADSVAAADPAAELLGGRPRPTITRRTSAVSSSATPSSTAPSVPQAPGLKFLYTAFVDCTPNMNVGHGPAGVRSTIPIVGGNVTGPLVKGTIQDVGADWGTTDPRTGIFSADTRYNMITDDGAHIFFRTSGPRIPTGKLHLGIIIETGSDKYYWMNNIVAVGVLQPVATSATGFTLRIDAWHVSDEPPSPIEPTEPEPEPTESGGTCPCACPA